MAVSFLFSVESFVDELGFSEVTCDNRKSSSNPKSIRKNDINLSKKSTQSNFDFWLPGIYSLCVKFIAKEVRGIFKINKRMKD